MIDPAARGAWADLDKKLRPFIARRVASGVDVEDVLQDVFLRMQRGLPALRDEQRFGPWVYQVARSAIADFHRAATRRPALPSTFAHPDEASSDVGAEEEAAAARELASHVTLFVSMLPSPYREALTLTELEGLTQREAARMFGISLSGMKSRVQRGRRLLKQALLDCCHIARDRRGQVIGCEPRPDGRLPPGCCPGRELPPPSSAAGQR